MKPMTAFSLGSGFLGLALFAPVPFWLHMASLTAGLGLGAWGLVFLWFARQSAAATVSANRRGDDRHA